MPRPVYVGLFPGRVGGLPRCPPPLRVASPGSSADPSASLHHGHHPHHLPPPLHPAHLPAPLHHQSAGQQQQQHDILRGVARLDVLQGAHCYIWYVLVRVSLNVLETRSHFLAHSRNDKCLIGQRIKSWLSLLG